MSSHPAAASWHGSARIGLGWGLFVGHAGDHRPHAHHAVQIVLSETPQRLWTPDQGWQLCHGAVIGPDVLHRLDQSSAPVTMLYLEPDSPDGRRAISNLASSWRALTAKETASALAVLRASPGAPDVSRVVDRLSLGAMSERETLQGDALIESLIAALPQALPGRLGSASLAARAGLSASRLQHRFRAHTGLALRPYLRWRRLLTALDAVGRGRSLTDAAFEAGFADAAHFTRTLRRHFGITPRVLLHLRT
ncbi:MAG: helix-turn-helix domain-containing protein [Pseudomonadota bacterium]